MAIFCEKFGWSYEQYMHSTNFVLINMMLADSPRMLSEKEKETLNKKKQKVKVNNDKDLQKELKQMFG